MTPEKRKLLLIALVSLLAGFCLTALVLVLGAGGWSTQAGLLVGLVVSAGFFLLALSSRWAGGERSLVWIVAFGLTLRLIISVGLTLALPVFGYDNDSHNAGYIFADSFSRDTQAWSLASSGEPILTAFENQYISDQYGGLLAILALEYRHFSPDAHRQMLPLIISATFFMIAVPFLWKTFINRWGRRMAVIATLVFVFYPEAVLLGSAHMREPFLLGLGAIATWAAADWGKNRKLSAFVLTVCAFGLLLISWRSGVIIIGLLVGWLIVDEFMEKWKPSLRVWGWLAMIGAILVFARISYAWIRETAVFDTYLTVQSSGILQMVFRQIGNKYDLAVVTLYGLSQPLLPAVLVALSNPIASAIAILRSLGWYFLAPALVFGFFASWKAVPNRDRRLLIWLTCFSLAWVVVSSYRAGGDTWDNPRYRTILLPWLALIAGWAWDWAINHRNPWLGRLYLIEGLAVLLITNLYLTRYTEFGIRIEFYLNFVIVAVSALLVIAIGLILDARKNRGGAG
jgi:hypothetical protein